MTIYQPHIVFQVNSTDEWNRQRIEGYGFARVPDTPGYHQLQVQTWRPRASLQSEIYSFFLGGSVRIQKLEEITRTTHGVLDGSGERDIINRFGMETVDAGTILVNMNVATQDIETRKKNRQVLNVVKNIERTETRKHVMAFTLQAEKEKKSRDAEKFANMSDEDVD